MGNNSAKQDLTAKYGGIYLKPNKGRYHPGDQFEGVIYLNLKNPYPGDSIYVIIKGIEKWKYAYETRTSRGRQVYHHLASDSDVFLIQRVPVYKNNGGNFQPGQYAFPFSFLIPLNVPSSVYQEGEQWIASIEFKVKAFLEPDDTHKTPVLKYKENILIEENRKLAGIPLQKTETIENVTCGCCFGGGMTTMSIALEKDYLAPGETTSMRFIVDNSQGKINFVRTRCELVEQITLGNRFSFRNTIVAVDLPGFKVKDTLPDQRVSLTLPPYNAANVKYKRIPFKRYRWGDVYAMRPTPGELVPTSLGKAVNIQFFLAVEPIYTGLDCCFINPIVSIPVQVYVPDTTRFNFNENVPVAPIDWNPRMMPTANLMLEMGNRNLEEGNQRNQPLVSVSDNVMN